MLDHIAAQEALRTLAETLVVARTGTMSLGASTSGYTRASGSFVTDGFAAGMEITPVGFPTNAPVIVKSVAPLLLSTVTPLAAVSAAGSRSIIDTIPADREWENTQNPGTTTVATRPKISDQWVPATSSSTGAPSRISTVTDTGLYVLTWFGLGNKGKLALRSEIQALKELYPPGLKIPVGDADLRITGNPGPLAGQLIPLDNGYTAVTLRIPWRAVSANVIPA
jgi:hypothetical protein